MQPLPMGPTPRVRGDGTPEFGWRLSDARPFRQAAYEIEVATSVAFAGADIVWRSGRVVSGQMHALPYGGDSLEPHRAYFWRVRLWGEDDAESGWSEPAAWETAKLSATDWTAEMITPETDAGVEGRCPTVTRTFDLPDLPARARLYITAYGLYSASINGEPVGHDELTPGWTSYTDRLGYQTYDVGALLRAGSNTITVTLADGWYRGRLCWPPNAIMNGYGTQIGCIAELRLTDAKGSASTIATDGSWRSGRSPVVFASIYDGETYDARLEGEDANVAGVRIIDFDKSTLVAQESETVQAIAELQPVEVTRASDGTLFYDFGQNIAGVVRFTVRGERGAKLTIDHAEIMRDGDLGQNSLRTAKARAVYTLRGEADETHQPSFTFMGFRHVRVSIEGKAELVSMVALPLSSALRVTGHFSCGDEFVTRLHENASWSLNGNFIDIPTDCPQRDERLGWCGDAQIFSPTANYLRDGAQFFKKWLRDMVADQRDDGAISHVVPNPTRFHEEVMPNFYGSAGWGDAICNVPWTIYLFYGDTEVLAETLPAMQRWVQYLLRYSVDNIVQPPSAMQQRGFTFGDWLQPTTFQGRLPPNAKPNPNTSDDYVATVFLYSSARTTARAAGVLGNKDVEAEYNAIADRVKTAFQREYITGSGRLASGSQGAYVFALYHDLLPDALVPQAVEALRKAIVRTEGHIATGIMSTPLVLPTLSKVGLHKEAIQLLLQKTNPAWLYQVKRGATTIWERWDGIDFEDSAEPRMNSYNHYAYGAVCFWFYHNLAGIQPDVTAPGFAKITLAPEFHRELSPLKASYDSHVGPISGAWTFDGDTVTYDVSTPGGTTTTLRLPAGSTDIRIDDAALSRQQASAATGTGLPMSPGPHRITLKLPTT